MHAPADAAGAGDTSPAEEGYIHLYLTQCLLATSDPIACAAHALGKSGALEPNSKGLCLPDDAGISELTCALSVESSHLPVCESLQEAQRLCFCQVEVEGV